MSYSDPMIPIIKVGALAPFSQPITFHYKEGTGEDVVKVELWDFTDPLDPQIQSFVLNVDYQIDEIDNEVDVLTAVPADHKLIIYRESDAIQTSNYSNGAFPAESVEEGLDKVMLVAQENQEKLSRALIDPIGLDTPTDITALSSQVATNTADIATNVIDIAANAANISSNDTDIATNAGNIATNTGDIATNTADIATNAGNIATNTADIATNAANIALLGTPTIVTTSNNYSPANAEIVILTANNLIITLPTPTAGHKVIVKLDGAITGTSIAGGGNNIDGAATHAMDSEYGSKTFIADGTNWFII
jgi:hypothetical protein